MKTMNLSDRAMLAAARRALARHLATRPASAIEAADCRQQLLDRAAEHDRLSRLRHRPLTASEIGHGPDAVQIQHAEGRAVTASVMSGLWHAAQASRLRLESDCWAVDQAAAWDRTRAELQARVDHYAALVR